MYNKGIKIAPHGIIGCVICSHFRKQLENVAKTIRDYCKQAHKDMVPCQEYKTETRTQKYISRKVLLQFWNMLLN